MDIFTVFPEKAGRKELAGILSPYREETERVIDLCLENRPGKSMHNIIVVGSEYSFLSHFLCYVGKSLESKVLVPVFPGRKAWGFSSFDDFIRCVAGSLSAILRSGTSPAGDTDSSVRFLKEVSRKYSPAVFIHDIQALFGSFKESDLMRLRGLLAQEGPFFIVGGANRVFPGISRRTSPFFGFFHVIHLPPIDNDSARKIFEIPLSKESRETGRSRAIVEALYRFVGSNPLFFYMAGRSFSSQKEAKASRLFLDSISAFMPAAEKVMDCLPPQQKKILFFLGSNGGACQVKNVAAECRLTEQTASSQLLELRKKDLVSFIRTGRNSFYEVKDPLLKASLFLWGNGTVELENYVDFLFELQFAGESEAEEIFKVFSTGPSDERASRKRINTLIRNFRKKYSAPEAGAVLFRSLPFFRTEAFSREAKTRWGWIWVEEGKNWKEFRQFARLYMEGLLYDRDSPARSFFTLPIEKRNLIASLPGNPGR